MTGSIEPSPHVSVPPPQRRAFVVFLMFNDSYLPGALTAAYGLERQNSPSQRVCVVTREISANARDMLSVLYDDIIEIEPIGVPEAENGQGSARQLTGSARVQDAALTRMGSLRLGPDGDLGATFEKVAVIDADLLPIRDFEDLWELPTPAGIINEHRSHMAEVDANGELIVRPETLTTGKWIWHDIYDEICPHGSLIPEEITDRVASDAENYGVNASLVLHEPSVGVYREFMAWAARPEIANLIRNEWSWIDQQAATLFWSGEWTSIDPSYSSFYGYPSLGLSRGLHFAGVKPWSWRKKGFERRLGRFPDYRMWADIYLEMFDAKPWFRQHGGLRKIADNLEAALEEADRDPPKG